MQYEWDEAKRLSNLVKHGLDFLDAWRVFASAHLVVPSVKSGAERRVLAVGMVENCLVSVIYTLRAKNLRIISFRRASREEKEAYHAYQRRDTQH